MKVFLLIAIIAMASCHTTVPEEHLDHDTIREDIIELINNEMETTWKAGVNNKFKNTSLRDFQKYLGALETPKAVLEQALPKMVFDDNQDLPENFDSRTNWSSCESIKEIRDQSTCGSCWAFAASETMSDRVCIHSGQKDQSRISSEDILSCCRTCGFGCNGGYPFAAFQFWQREGVVSGGLYGDKQTCSPYAFPPCEHHTTGKYEPCGSSKPTPKCVKRCQNENLNYETDKRYGSAYSVAANERAIMNEIFKNGPVSAAFTVYEDFPTYKSGVYQHTTGGALGGHAVKMIGWGVENGTKYWLIVNSWNEDWGDKGTFKILRGKNHCGIEDEIVAGIPQSRGMKFLEDN